MPLGRSRSGDKTLGLLMLELRRKSKNPKQRFVAKAMRIKPDTLSEFERGLTMPLREDLENFTKALNLQPLDQEKLYATYATATGSDQDVTFKTLGLNIQRVQEIESIWDLRNEKSNVLNNEVVADIARILNLSSQDLVFRTNAARPNIGSQKKEIATTARAANITAIFNDVRPLVG